ncbi:hypothetical protein [Chitinivorax sp. B]|uniref:hypothetical protein n=1 Tax=Chitinivorax sp. B TaxID=2502235 RepID=UPI0010F74FEF|nr:hypothetical protein [Chitinivorax sp. B]
MNIRVKWNTEWTSYGPNGDNVQKEKEKMENCLEHFIRANAAALGARENDQVIVDVILHARSHLIFKGEIFISENKIADITVENIEPYKVALVH